MSFKAFFLAEVQAFLNLSCSLSPDVNVINISKCHLVVLAPLLSPMEIFLGQQKYRNVTETVIISDI